METVIVSLTKELLKSHTTKTLSKKATEALIHLYNEHKDELRVLIESGFDENFVDINFSAWFKFVITMIVKAEKLRKLSGKEKKEVIMEMCFVLIRKELKVSNDIKELLITLLEVTLPQMIDSIISTTKKIHTFGSKLRKKFCCC